jgi:hypothetical protein
MSKKLAIQGHPTRGKEVIELLEMIGGVNSWKASGNIEKVYYSISNGAILYSPQIEKDTVIYTLEKFLEKYPFKIGDKVIDLKTNKIAEVYKMHWSENTNCVYYDIKYPNNYGCTRRLMDLKSMNDNKDVHSISECKTIGQGTYAIKIADGYKFDSIDENGNIIVKSIKPKYPTTYDECCDILNIETNRIIDYDDCLGYRDITQYDTKLLTQLRCLRKICICRDAYWKIAGEQMGLDKPWEPDWSNDDETKFCIYTTQNIISLDIFGVDNRILAFPTEEMRDTFFENFKDLIEKCKELL